MEQTSSDDLSDTKPVASTSSSSHAPGSSADLQIEDLPPSKLGTQAYWDAIYERDSANYSEIGEEGEVWFGEDKARRMVRWVKENKKSIGRDELSVLDVGTGNGHLLFSLVEAEIDLEPKRMKGIDYSPQSISLSKAIGLTREKECEGCADVTFDVVDILSEEMSGPPDTDPGSNWDIVLDKGTFDALSLSSDPIPLPSWLSMASDTTQTSLKPSQIYPLAIGRLLAPGGLFLITSCNFTEKEIRAAFEGSSGMRYHSNAEYKSFSFGGSVGTTVCTVGFQKI